MTKKRKHRRNSLYDDFNTPEDGLILANVEITPDGDEPDPVALQHFIDDDEAIDRLLVGSDFSTNPEQEEDYGQVVGFFDSDDVDFVGRYVVEPIDQASQQHVEHDLSAVKAAVGDSQALPDAIDKLLINTGFDNPDVCADGNEPVLTMPLVAAQPLETAADQRGCDETAAGDGLEAAGADDFFASEEWPDATDMEESAAEELPLTAQTLDRFAAGIYHKPEQDGSGLPEDDLTGAEAVIADVAPLRFGMGAGRFAKQPTMANAQSAFAEGATVAETVLDQDTPMPADTAAQKLAKANLVTYAALGFGALALLSTLVMALMLSSVHSEVAKLKSLVSILEEDMTGLAEKAAETAEVADEPGLPQNPRPPADAVAVPVPVPVPQVRVKPVPAKVADTVKLKPTSQPAKKNKPKVKKNLSKVTKVVTYPLQTAGKSVKVVSLKAKKKPSPTVDNKAWVVKIIDYKDLGLAKSRAAALKQKGIPVKIITSTQNKVKHYQLKVEGFQSQQKAEGYAAKLKKSHHLHTIAVTPQ